MMSGRRKVHTKTDLTVPMVEQREEADGTKAIPAEALPPGVTVVTFPPNASNVRSMDFAPFYGHGIDEITYACQRQIERFLAMQDGEREVSTVVSIAKSGLATFLSYLILRSAALGRQLRLADLDREVIVLGGDEIDELGAGTRVEPAFIDDLHAGATLAHASCPRYSEATVM